ncbi:hypothetical protein K7432_006222 [Basidiobolus ranarum]|uniref:Uncharacterized protein n=1 Tax=Basidiobolus ranarum TaxID=34480 RepID=A0ABR2WV78_9FUNG
MHSHFRSVQVAFTVVGLILVISLIICNIYLKRPHIRDLVIVICTYVAIYVLYMGFANFRQRRNRRRNNQTPTLPSTSEIPPVSYPTYTDYRNSLLPPLRTIPQVQIPIPPVEEAALPSYNMAINEPAPSYRSASNLSIQTSHNP